MNRGNLILSRYVGESVEIGSATVTVIGVEGGRVKLAIEAPTTIKVRRGNKEALVAASAPQSKPLLGEGVAMTIIRHESYAGPPVQECCGKRHPLPWTHPGMIRCGHCGVEAPKPRGKRYGSMFCEPCEIELTS